jgi:hypothetical protein
MVKIIKIPKVGGKYKSKNGRTISRVLDVFEDNSIIRVYFSDYDRDHDVSLDSFWGFFNEDEQI